MGYMIIFFFLVALIAFGFFAYLVSIYNGLILVKNNIKKSWANIDVLLKQRFDELTKILDVVKGYMKYETEVLENLTKARTEFLSAKTIPEKANAEATMVGAFKSLVAVAENYPNLKASENFLHLQTRVSGLENEIADRREFYNESVNNYNIRIESFPDMIVAKFMNLKPEETFIQVTEEEKKDVKISF